MSRVHRFRSVGLMATVSCVALTGCVSETPSGSGSTFKFEWWIPTLITVISLIAIVGGVVLMTRKKQGAWVGVLLGVIGLLLGPNMFFDKAVVDDEHFELRTGFFFSPTAFDIRWDNVLSINGTAEEKTGRRGRKSTSFYLNFALKSGGTEKVPVGDLMKNGAAKKLFLVADKKNIPLSGVTNIEE